MRQEMLACKPHTQHSACSNISEVRRYASKKCCSALGLGSNHTSMQHDSAANKDICWVQDIYTTHTVAGLVSPLQPAEGPAWLPGLPGR